MFFWFRRNIRKEDMPEEFRLLTKEYLEVYHKNGKHRTGFTPYEKGLTWVFTIIYAVFGIFIVARLIVSVLAS